MKDVITNNLKTTLQVYLTDDVIVFSRPKNASRVTSSYLTFGSAGFEAEISFDYSKGGKPELQIGDQIRQKLSKGRGGDTQSTITDAAIRKQIYNEINSVLNGKSKKDVIFVYRNTWDRFISGLYQEYIVAMMNKDFFYHMTLPLSAKEKEQLKKFAKLISFVMGRMKSEADEANTFVEQQTEMIRGTLKYWLEFNKNNYGYDYTHTNNYLGLYNELLNDYKINLDKVKLVNVSNIQIEEILKPYCKNLQHERVLDFEYDEKGRINKDIFSSKPIKDLIVELLKEDNNNLALQYYLQEEFKYFFKISEHPNNITDLNITKHKLK